MFEDDENIHLVMELCSGGGILDRMKDGTLTEARVADIMRFALPATLQLSSPLPGKTPTQQVCSVLHQLGLPS